MRLLLINGSPRKGNTWKLTNEVKESLLRFCSDIEFDEIHLNNINLPLCTGCSSCFRKGHEYCPHSAITQEVMDKIEVCDGVIFSVSSYQMHVPALTKNLTDHFCFMLHRPRFFNKKALIISTTGGVGANGTTKFLADTLRGWGFNRCYELPIGAYSYNDYQFSLKDAKKVEKISGEYYHDLVSNKLHSPKLGVLIPFNLFRGMRNEYVPGAEFETQDGVYWTAMGFEKSCYANSVPMPIHKKIFGSLFYCMAKVISKRMIVTYKK